MSIFKDLLSSYCLRRSTPSLQPARWHRIREALRYAASSTEEEEEERMLPSNHPQTIRVQRMAVKLIAAACDDTNYGHRRLSDRIRRPFDGIDWTVGVVDARDVNGRTNATGDIVVSTGLLRYLRKDAAVATVLGHEVGHVIARHAEKRMRNWFLVGFLVHFAGALLEAPPGDKATQREWRSLFMRPCYYSQEYEADHLGLLVLAAAGYDPRAGPATYMKLGELGDAAPDDIRCTHPASTKRAQRLSQAKVMDEALDLYRQAVRSGKGTEALDSRKSTFRSGLSWCQFWMDNCLQGVSRHFPPLNLLNYIRSSLPPKPSLSSCVRNSVRNSCIVAQAAPANRWWIEDSVGSLSFRQAICKHGTGYATGWQPQKDDDDDVDAVPGPDCANSAHGTFFPGNVDFLCAKPLREPWAPPKVKLFMSKLLHGRLLPIHKECPFCGQEPESAAHIAFNCCFAKEVWRNILSWAGVPVVFPPAVPSVDVWWKHLRSSAVKDGRRALDTLLVSTIWHLWMERNARLFTEKMMMTSTKLTIKIHQETFAWINGACAKHPAGSGEKARGR